MLLTPAGLIAAVAALRSEPRAVRGANQEEGRRRLRFARAFALVPLAVFAGFALTHSPKLNWAGPLWLAVLPGVAAWLVAWADPRTGPRPWISRVAAATFAFLLLGYGAALHQTVAGAPWLFPWRDLATEIEALDRALETETGRDPLLVGMDKYFIASELAFYDVDGLEEAVGRDALGMSALMHRYWRRGEPREGKAAILVALDPEDLERPTIGRFFEEIGVLHERSIPRRGWPAARYYYRIGYKYRFAGKDVFRSTGSLRGGSLRVVALRP